MSAAPASAGTGGSTLANDDEIFDVVDEANEVVGSAARATVHKEGLLHRAVNVVLVDGDGRVLLQQRALGKKINGGKWDVSVGEHNNPGEDYPAAALRGLFEELGIVAPDTGLALLQQVIPPTLYKNAYPDIGLLDNEFCALYAWTGFDPHAYPVVVDGIEVSAVKWVPIAELSAAAAAQDASFTPTLTHAIPHIAAFLDSSTS